MFYFVLLAHLIAVDKTMHQTVGMRIVKGGTKAVKSLLCPLKADFMGIV